jgi:hypothetical protein
MIAVPRFRRVAGIGDEAYVLSEAHLLFRTGAIVFHVGSSDMSFDVEEAVAKRLVASTQSSTAEEVPFIPSIGARVRIRSSQLGPGWRVGMFNQTRQVPPCYVVLLFDPGAERRITMTVPAGAVSRLELSRLYPGSPADPDPGAAAHDGETWVNVPLDSIQHTGRTCQDSITR